MDYWYSLRVPYTASIASPERKTAILCPGIVKQVWLMFPKGHKGTTKLRILRAEHQVWPTNLDEWYLGDGTVIQFSEEYPLMFAPFDLILEGYNDSSDTPHTVYTRFTIHAVAPIIIPGPFTRVEDFL